MSLIEDPDSNNLATIDAFDSFGDPAVRARVVALPEGSGMVPCASGVVSVYCVAWGLVHHTPFALTRQYVTPTLRR